MPVECADSLPAPAVENVREVVLDGGHSPLSALLALPRDAPPRAVVVALHGGGMRAAYFHGAAHPSLSLLKLGASLGFAVLAVDRPGYGLSTTAVPRGESLVEQARTLSTALEDFAARQATGAGLFLVGHSYGGKAALAVAAHRGEADGPLLGLDVSGVGHRYAIDVNGLGGFHGRRTTRLHWGPLRLYPPNTFRLAEGLVTTMPEREETEASLWPELFPGVAGRVRVPVRFTYAEYERWWLHDEATLEEMTGLLTAPRVVVDRLPRAGHNISLGWAARAYHLRALAFLEECLSGREQSPRGA
ncbi:alpha/beta hydrolase [Streptomyces neyagawaensis]|uniref:Alpha/beta fold hydrolase n=1 Tax=Streptomyces neyagawaensis TaxID=42238 RepID=A0ABV3AUS6_9ACTN